MPGAWSSFADYVIEAADALYENRPVEDATGHRDTAVPTLMDQGPDPP
ncbi:hypothetical protein ACSCBZ_01410 [Streptomyces niveiscabiei]|uniref:Uncharacterized protein n=1 Tax=Streptomyces niveiscabiei TaxID=164115 RepID=A0ABW9I6Q3_9ACTN|nr:MULTISPECIES: hypothetical protein [Streptomyces]